MQSCKQCGFKFTLLSQRFYCCNPSEVVCSVCHRQECKKCQKPRTNEIILPKCSQCSARLYESDLLFQYNCQRYFCSKCLSGIFKDAYDKVTIQKMYDTDTQVFVRFMCGHEYSFEQLVGFFRHFCICCGAQYDGKLDYEFSDGVKLCFMCYRYFGKKYQSLLIKCEMCQTIIKNSSQASILENTDVAICKKCTIESQHQEKMLEKSKMEKKSGLQQQSFGLEKKDDFLSQQPTHTQEKQIEQQKQHKQQYQQQQITAKPTSKLIKKQSISQLKKKQQSRTSSLTNPKPPHSFSVTNKFSNNFQQLDQQTTQSLGLQQSIKLKRYLSTQTYVQQFKIDVPQNIECEFVRCRRCSVKVSFRDAFDLYRGSEKKIPECDRKRSLVDFTIMRTSSASLSNQQENSYFICRVCYSRSAQRQKSLILSSSRTKLQPSTRPSKLQEPPIDKMDYLKVGQSSSTGHVFNRSPSPSPMDKQYSLTGSRGDLTGSRCSINEVRQALLGSGVAVDKEKQKVKEMVKQKQTEKQKEKQKKPIIVQKQYTKPIIHPVSGQSRTSMSNNPPRYMKCDACRDVKKSLIATSTQGYLCDDCYYFKNPAASQAFFHTGYGKRW